VNSERERGNSPQMSQKWVKKRMIGWRDTGGYGGRSAEKLKRSCETGEMRVVIFHITREFRDHAPHHMP
jgi:hypothetical protein